MWNQHRIFIFIFVIIWISHCEIVREKIAQHRQIFVCQYQICFVFILFFSSMQREIAQTRLFFLQIRQNFFYILSLSVDFFLFVWNHYEQTDKTIKIKQNTNCEMCMSASVDFQWKNCKYKVSYVYKMHDPELYLFRAAVIQFLF